MRAFRVATALLLTILLLAPSVLPRSAADAPGNIPPPVICLRADCIDRALGPPPTAKRDDPVQNDSDHDAMGDTWQKTYRDAGAILAPFEDLDEDCLTNVGEFAWLLVPVGPLGPLFPNARDFDGDNLTDGDEVALWNHPGNDGGPYYAERAPCHGHPPNAPVAVGASTTGMVAVDPDALLDTDHDGVPNARDPDADNDTLLDGDEVHGVSWLPWHFTSDPALVDTDGDGLTDGQESGPTGYRSNPRAVDSDLDGIPDATEAERWIALGIDPRSDLDGDGLPALLDADSDGDGLDDGAEAAWRTNMSLADSDGDGMSDGYEAAHALDPLDPADASADPDADSLVNLAEFNASSDPHVADTDRDGLDDGIEVAKGLRADAWDTDQDGMPDGWEIDFGFDPKNAADGAADADEDAGRTVTGASFVDTNSDEYRYARPSAWNESRDGPWLNGTNPRDADTDRDGVSDGQEVVDGTPASGPTSVNAADVDGDGLANRDEIAMGLDPLNADSDGDGLCDGGEGPACSGPDGKTLARGEILDYQSNPYSPNTDSDGDGLSDYVEASNSTALVDVDHDGLTSLVDGDSDADGLGDGVEISIGTDPQSNDTDLDTLTDSAELDLGTDPLRSDTDGDGVGDALEIRYGSDPLRSDEDADGLQDGAELSAGTDPWNADTDADGMPDGWEARYHLNPLAAADALVDTDGDTLRNVAEFNHHTDPTASDTDMDTIPDGAEVLLGTNPTWDDLRLGTDDDGDGLSAVQEYVYGTDPRVSDTDGDGTSDSAEALLTAAAPANVSWPSMIPRVARIDPVVLLMESDPALADTDHDGLDDTRERALWATVGPDAVRTDYQARAGHPQPGFVSNLRVADADGDGLDDGQEFLVLGTNATKGDTDGDSYTDFDEVHRGSDPLDPTSTPRTGARLTPGVDSDGDHLTDAIEILETRTDPKDPDTDHDGIDDGNEVVAWTTRLHVAPAQVYAYLRNPDVDGDGLPDGEEFATGALPRQLYAPTDPYLADSDRDGISDGKEARNAVIPQSLAALEQGASRDPLSPFLALGESMLPPGAIVGAWNVVLIPIRAPTPFRDAVPRSVETPTAPEPAPGCRAQSGSAPDRLDSDDDGLSDAFENPTGGPQRGDPCSTDGDGDGIPDAYEERRLIQADPDGDGKLPALDKDSDGDGLNDPNEDLNHNGLRDPDETSALDADTDDDGLTDKNEANLYGTSPLNPDSDADGLPDGLEVGVATPESSLGAAFGTDTRAQRMCGSVAIGPAFASSTTGFHLDPTRRDYDSDGIIDGFEDFNANGVYGPGSPEGRASETLPGGAPELNPLASDSDGDGRLDGEELNLHNNDGVCGQIAALGGSMASVATRLGFDAAVPDITNPHVPDTDGDGTLDATDVDPRHATTILSIPITYQQTEAADPYGPGCWGPKWCESDPYAPDLSIHLSVEAASSTVPLDVVLLDDLHAKNPVNPWQLIQGDVAPSGHSVAWALTRDMLSLKLPQAADGFAVASDPQNAHVTISAVDRDNIFDDPIAFSAAANGIADLKIPLIRTHGAVIETHGTTDETKSYSPDYRGARNAALRLSLPGALDGMFFFDALAHVTGRSTYCPTLGACGGSR